MTEATWQELKDLRDSGQLVPGMKYRMNDYDTYTGQSGTSSAMHPFDLILTALDERNFSEEVSAIWSARDTDGYFANMSLPSWELKYTIDNDTSRFSWAVAPSKSIVIVLTEQIVHLQYDGTIEFEGIKYYKWITSLGGRMTTLITENDTPVNGDIAYFYDTELGGELDIGLRVERVEITTAVGKGVIYRMVDEYQNECPYDFKNILYSLKLTNGVFDYENGVGTLVYTFDCYNDGIHTDYSESCSGNYMPYTRGLASNIFLNVMGNICANNTFGSNCASNVFGNNCIDNTFGNNCVNNIFGDNCTSNTFGNNCTNNTFGNNCSSNTFGNNCEWNKWRNHCSYNIQGDNCRNNELGVENQDFYAKNIHFTDNSTHTQLRNDQTASEYNAVQHYRIDRPIKVPVVNKEVSVERNRKYVTIITDDKSGAVVEYTIDDIKNA